METETKDPPSSYADECDEEGSECDEEVSVLPIQRQSSSHDLSAGPIGPHSSIYRIRISRTWVVTSEEISSRHCVRKESCGTILKRKKQCQVSRHEEKMIKASRE